MGSPPPPAWQRARLVRPADRQRDLHQRIDDVIRFETPPARLGYAPRNLSHCAHVAGAVPAAPLLALALLFGAPAHAQDDPPPPPEIDLDAIISESLEDNPPSFGPPRGGRLETVLRTNCRVTGEASECTFQNDGNATGHGCVRVTVRGPGGESVSDEACCEPLAAAASVVRPVTFSGTPPSEVCVRDGAVDFNACRVSVEMTDVTVDEGVPVWVANAAPLVSFGLVLLGAFWVGWDARRRKDPNAVQWAIGTVLLCAVAFPLYVLWGRRQKNVLLEELGDDWEPPADP